MDRVLGDHRRDVGGDVLDDAGPRAAAGSHRPVALGTGREGVLLAAVDPRRRGPTMTGMSRLGPFGLGPSLGGRLGVGRGLPEGADGSVRGRRGGRLLGQLLGQGQQREDDRLLALLEDQRGLLGGQLRTEQGLQGCRIQGVRTRRCHGHSGRSAVIGLQDQLNSAEGLREFELSPCASAAV